MVWSRPLTVGMACQANRDPIPNNEQRRQPRPAVRSTTPPPNTSPTSGLATRWRQILASTTTSSLFAEGVAPVLDHADRVGVRLVMENWANGGRNLAYAPAHLGRDLRRRSPPRPWAVSRPPRTWSGWGSTTCARYASSVRASTTPTPRTPNSYRTTSTGTASSARSADAIGQSTYRFRIPGFGVVDWPGYITALLEVGFNGALVVEHEDAFWSSQTDVQHALNGLVLAQRFLSPLLV